MTDATEEIYTTWLYRVIGEKREPGSTTFKFNTIPVEGKIFKGDEVEKRKGEGWNRSGDAITAITDIKTGEISKVASVPSKKRGRPFSKGTKK